VATGGMSLQSPCCDVKLKQSLPTSSSHHAGIHHLYTREQQTPPDTPTPSVMGWRLRDQRRQKNKTRVVRSVRMPTMDFGSPLGLFRGRVICLTGSPRSLRRWV